MPLLVRLNIHGHPLLGGEVLKVFGEAAAFAGKLAGVFEAEEHAERLAVADAGGAVHRHAQLRFIEQFLVVIERVQRGFGAGMVLARRPAGRR